MENHGIIGEARIPPMGTARRAYQVSGIRRQESDQLAAALPPWKSNKIPIGFHLSPVSRLLSPDPYPGFFV
ncbi:MAG: hypothetical protein LBM17_08560 [Candidatus Accumulibacter sp.]|nr:hypothetical protein [Accumulibacter sp.]